MADWDATTYDRIADPMTAWGARVVARTELAGDELVVDAGCGTGRVTELLLERLGPGGRVVGIDRSPAMVAEAGRRLARFGDRVELLVADLAEPLPVREVDMILSTATFHWIHDHDGLFANLFQALRPGGVLVAQFGGAGNIAAVDRALDELGRGTGPTGPRAPDRPLGVRSGPSTSRRRHRLGRAWPRPASPTSRPGWNRPRSASARGPSWRPTFAPSSCARSSSRSPRTSARPSSRPWPTASLAARSTTCA